MYYLNHYVIDWEKVKTLEDVKRLLKAMDIAFEPDVAGIDSIKDLLRMEAKKRAGSLQGPEIGTPIPIGGGGIKLDEYVLNIGTPMGGEKGESPRGPSKDPWL